MHPEDFKLTAYALGELEPADQTVLEEHLRDCAVCRLVVDEARAFGTLVAGELEKEPCPEPALWPRNVFYERVTLANVWRPSRWRWVEVSLASAAALFLLAGLSGLIWQSRRERLAQSGAPAFDTQMAGAPQAPSSGYFRYGPNEAAQPTENFDTSSLEVEPPSSLTPQPPSAAPAAGKENAARKSVDYGVAKPQYETKAKEAVAPSPTPLTASLATTPASAVPASGMAQFNVPNPEGGRGFGQHASVRRAATSYGHPASLSVIPGLNPALPPGAAGEVEHNTEAYDRIDDNPFREVHDHPLSTFSIDVDTASYSNLRRFLTSGARPPKDAVRIEELLNYFAYDYSPPQDDKPFATHVEVAECPWNGEHRLVRIALKGREINAERRPVSNLVFLLDVSGSMQPANKLPLVKQAMQLLVQKLGENDRVAIVVYAGASGLVLPSTTCDQKKSILGSLERLQNGGSTAGAAGIELAYDVARKNFIKGGTNRVILCTDGDFNVGITDPESLKSLIKEKSADGVFLSVLGFGMGNLKDDRLEMLADNGNGNYAYIDNEKEAKKVLVDQMSGTLVTIAKDVKIQIEFNPAQVAIYRLIGYENRVLQAEDFNNDKKDAGEIGAGHTVTALYEIVPAGHTIGTAAVDPLKYQKPTRPVVAAPTGDTSQELLTLKLRYKEPDGQTSRLLEYPITDSNQRFSESTKDFRFAAAVAEFGMLLRDSQHRGNATLDSVLELAQEGLGADREGYRAEFINLVNLAKQLRP